MREAIGGSILFYIILGFLGIFIVFIAIIMNYASAYRTNNYVVNMIEQTEGEMPFQGNGNDSRGLVDYLKRNNYNNGLSVSCSQNSNGSVYHVTTYIKFYIPIIDVGFPIAINNDTKTIYQIYCEDSSQKYNKNRQSIGNWNGDN